MIEKTYDEYLFRLSIFHHDITAYKMKQQAVSLVVNQRAVLKTSLQESPFGRKTLFIWTATDEVTF
jgi:hypothetical protein